MKSIVLAGLRIQENEAEWEQKLSEAAMLWQSLRHGSEGPRVAEGAENPSAHLNRVGESR